MSTFNEFSQWLEGSLKTEGGDWNIIGKLILALIIFLVIKVTSSVITSTINSLMEKDVHVINYAKHKTLTSLIGKAIRYALYFIGLIQILDLFGVPTGSIIATAGIGGVAIGFGAKSLVEDVISGMFILIEDKYRLGDQVIIDGFEGVILDFGLRTTTVRGFNGAHFNIRNGTIDSLINKSRENQRLTVNLQVPLNTDLDKVKEIVDQVSKKLMDKHSFITQPPFFVGVTATASISQTITVWSWTKPGKQASVELVLREELIRAFNKEGIGIPKILMEEQEL